MNSIAKINIENFRDKRGNLIPIEKSESCLPFHALRTFYLIDIPVDAKRAGHAINNEIFIFALKGSVKLVYTDHNLEKQEWLLYDTSFGLYVPPMHFIELIDFEKDSTIVVLASKNYCDTTYYTLEEIIAHQRQNLTR